MNYSVPTTTSVGANLGPRLRKLGVTNAESSEQRRCTVENKAWSDRMQTAVVAAFLSFLGYPQSATT